jgi:heat shock protein HslJ
MNRFILVGFQLFVAAIGFLCLTVGCTTKDDTEKTPTHTYIVPVTSEPDPLDGSLWELVTFESEVRTPSIPEQSGLFIAVNRGELILQSGCNTVNGHYQIENNRITITFVEATLVDCSDSMPGINDIEEAFSNAMPTFESYLIEGDQLRIRYADGELLFRRVSE